MKCLWLSMLGMVLLTGTVEAGESPVTTIECRVDYHYGTPMSTCDPITLGEKAIREAGAQWVPCSQLYGPAEYECRVKGEVIETRQPCPQRMREAMLAMDGHFIYTAERNRGFIEPISAATYAQKAQWDAVMKECVK